VSELTEGVAALATDRAPQWSIGMTFRDVRPYEAPADA
jgi:hypothetical protein